MYFTSTEVTEQGSPDLWVWQIWQEFFGIRYTGKVWYTRLPMDLEGIDGMDKNSVRLEYPDVNNMQKFFVYIKVSEGLYKGKWFKFSFVIPNDWPNRRPRVLIVNKIWHPNIGLVEDGHPEYGVVSVSTLDFYSQDTLLQMIIESLKYILINPNPNDPHLPSQLPHADFP